MGPYPAPLVRISFPLKNQQPNELHTPQLAVVGLLIFMIVAFDFPVSLVEAYRMSYTHGSDPLDALQRAGVPLVTDGGVDHGCIFSVGAEHCTVTFVRHPDAACVKYQASFFSSGRDCFEDVLEEVVRLSRPFLFVRDEAKKFELVSVLGLN